MGKGRFVKSRADPSVEVEIPRTVTNLIPANSVQHPTQGDAGALPCFSQWGSLVLEENEILVAGGGDMVCMVYIFQVPEEWHPDMAFGDPLDSGNFGLEPGIPMHIAFPDCWHGVGGGLPSE